MYLESALVTKKIIYAPSSLHTPPQEWTVFCKSYLLNQKLDLTIIADDKNNFSGRIQVSSLPWWVVPFNIQNPSSLCLR